MIEEIKCPKCGSTNLRFNDFKDAIPLKDQFLFVCLNPDCRQQFDPPEEAMPENDNFKS